MHELASCFGPIEYFRPYVPLDDGPALPPGHDAQRLTHMDERVWEAKWEHRDDCITALNVSISTHIDFSLIYDVFFGIRR